jgi:hypothetical protein
LEGENREQVYHWIEQVLRQQQYAGWLAAVAALQR